MIYTPRSEFFTPDFPSSEAKVGQSHSHLLGIPATSFDFLVGIPTEDVLGLQIAVNNIVLVKIAEGEDDDGEIEARDVGCEATNAKEMGKELAAGDVRQQHVDVQAVLERRVKVDDEGMPDA